MRPAQAAFFMPKEEANISIPREILFQRQAQAEEKGLRYCSGCRNELDPSLFHQPALGGAFRIPDNRCCYCNANKSRPGFLPRPEPWKDPRPARPIKGQDNFIESNLYGMPTGHSN